MNLRIAIVFLLLVANGKLFAQSDASSRVILENLNQKFKRYNVVKTNFTITITYPQQKRKETQNGTLYLKTKDSRYKIIFQNQEILSDGKNQWTYLKTDNEVQLNEVRRDDNTLNPIQLFTNYDKGYKTKFNGETKIGTITYQNIELVPIAEKSFFKIKMTINKNKNQIYSLSVLEKNGNIYSYLVNNLISVKNISDSFFVWDKKAYPNVDLQDLR